MMYSDESTGIRIIARAKEPKVGGGIWFFVVIGIACAIALASSTYYFSTREQQTAVVQRCASAETDWGTMGRVVSSEQLRGGSVRDVYKPEAQNLRAISRVSFRDTECNEHFIENVYSGLSFRDGETVWVSKSRRLQKGEEVFSGRVATLFSERVQE